MSDPLVHELQALRAMVASLSKRLDLLEARVAGRTATPAPSVRPPSHVAAAPVAAARPAPPPRKRESLETTIGRVWLNRIGITSLVLGVAFFILYSFQYLGPAAKIAIGFAVGLGLLGGGVVIERTRGLAWYGRGLLGGGWAIIYFTTYAMYHIPVVRVLPHALLDLVLLWMVAAGAVTHALRYRSQVITALAFSLGFVTTSVSSVTYFTLASSALLVVALMSVAVRMRWHALLLYGVAGSYLTHLVWVQHQIAMSPAIARFAATAAASQFWLNAGFLVLYWAAYLAGTMRLDERDVRRRNMLLTAGLGNGLLFVTSLVGSMEPVYPKARYLVLLGVGVLYLALSAVASRRKLPALSNAHLLLGLTFATLAIPERLTDRWTSFLWTVEVAALTGIGLRYQRWAYRLFAFGLGIMVFARWLTIDCWTRTMIEVFADHVVPWRLLIGLTAIAAFAAAATCYRRRDWRASQRRAESQAFHVYLTAASSVAWMLTLLEVHREHLALVWALGASVMVLLGWRLSDRASRMVGLTWFVTIALRLLFELSVDPIWRSTPAIGAVIGLLYGMGALYRATPTGATFTVERALRHVYTATASLVLTWLLWLDVSSQWISLAWAAEGLALVAVGFLLRDVAFRVAGLGVFAFLVLKILFVDLAGAETIYRILSFLVAGAILLVASLAYAKFAGRSPGVKG